MDNKLTLLSAEPEAPERRLARTAPSIERPALWRRPFPARARARPHLSPYKAPKPAAVSTTATRADRDHSETRQSFVTDRTGNNTPHATLG